MIIITLPLSDIKSYGARIFRDKFQCFVRLQGEDLASYLRGKMPSRGVNCYRECVISQHSYPGLHCQTLFNSIARCWHQIPATHNPPRSSPANRSAVFKSSANQNAAFGSRGVVLTDVFTGTMPFTQNTALTSRPPYLLGQPCFLKLIFLDCVSDLASLPFSALTVLPFLQRSLMGHVLSFQLELTVSKGREHAQVGSTAES